MIATERSVRIGNCAVIQYGRCIRVRKKRKSKSMMLKTNPKYVLRNWMAQLAIDAAEEGDFSICEKLHTMLKKPYSEQSEFEVEWYKKRPKWAQNRVGCSMLSCSS